MKILTLDAEFAINEILELSMSVWDSTSDEEGREVLHELFRPRNEHRWPGSERVHHISPKMVAAKPHFSKFRKKIQILIDSADCLGGFAIENDVAALMREGITGLEDKPYIDVRDIHWLLHGRDQGVELDARKGLAVTAADLGVEFSESDAHGASYDTLKTQECLMMLWDSFLRRYPVAEDSDLTPLQHYSAVWEEAKSEYYREFARGWISLIPAEGGYRIKASRMQPEDGKYPLSIPVAARQKALNELDAMLDRRRSATDANVYDLRPSDMKKIEQYTNVYDEQEATHRKMHQLRVMTYKQLHRF